MSLPRALVLACALAMALTTAEHLDKKFNITIGFLTAQTGWLRDRQGVTIPGATTVALEELNNNAEILPDVKILLEWRDTKSKPALDLMTDMISKNVVAFFGPEQHCYSEAVLANQWNLPMFSYKCDDSQAAELPNFVKMDPTPDQALKTLISLLRYYRWNKFSIVFEEPWRKETQNLQAYAEANKMTVNHIQSAPDPSENHRVVYNTFNNVVFNTMNTTRVYVYLGSPPGLLNMMSAMDTKKLFDHGEYMVIFIDMHTYLPHMSLQYLIEPDLRYYQCPDYTTSFKRRARSLLVVTSSELPPAYEKFAEQVRQRDEEEPFYLPEMFRSEGLKKYISIHAAYLYDSIKLYAKALDELIKEDTQTDKLDYDKLMRIVKNGSRIVDRVVKKSPYESISGFPIRFNEQGIAQGSFSLLAFKNRWLQMEMSNCSHSMVPVGHFKVGDRPYPEYKLNPRLPIDWAVGVKPEDEPSCGYHHEKCPIPSTPIPAAWSILPTDRLHVILIFFFLIVVVSLCILIISKSNYGNKEKKYQFDIGIDDQMARSIVRWNRRTVSGLDYSQKYKTNTDPIKLPLKP